MRKDNFLFGLITTINLGLLAMMFIIGHRVEQQEKEIQEKLTRVPQVVSAEFSETNREDIYEYTVEPHEEVLSELPVEYQNYCFEIGEEYGVSPHLLMAIIEHESGRTGNPDAVNDAGNCVGLMQVNKHQGVKYIDGITTADLFDPRTNIEVGTLILIEKASSDLANGDVAMALALYNGQSKPNPNSKYVREILDRANELEEWDYGCF